MQNKPSFLANRVLTFVMAVCSDACFHLV